MAGRRVLYGALLIGATVLHFAYGQYITHYVLLFLLCLPVLSFLISLPAMLTARAELFGGEDVMRNRACRIRLNVESKWFLPPEAWTLVIEMQNLFTDRQPTFRKIRFTGVRSGTQSFTPDTGKLGTIRYRIKRARVCDYLGLISIPIRRSGAAVLTVMPESEAPVPDPQLAEPSERIMKPKPYGFSEEHELRPYREGDAINLIHWKLSQKYDEPIVREPQELMRRNIVLTADLPAEYEQQQSVLEQLRYLNDSLAEQKIPYLLHFGMQSQMIRSNGEFERFIKTVLSEPMRSESSLPVYSGNDTLVYRIVPKKEAGV